MSWQRVQILCSSLQVPEAVYCYVRRRRRGGGSRTNKEYGQKVRRALWPRRRRRRRRGANLTHGTAGLGIAEVGKSALFLSLSVCLPLGLVRICLQQTRPAAENQTDKIRAS